MTSKYKKAIYVLMIFYSMIAFLSLTPHVSNEYHDYYISKRSKLSPREISSMKFLEPRLKYTYSDSAIGFADGWAYPEEKLGLRWSLGKISHILFKIDAREKFKGILILNFGSLGKQYFSLSINKHKIYSGITTGQNEMIEVNFDHSLLTEGINIIEFQLPNAHKPSNRDQRLLALALKSFQLQ